MRTVLKGALASALILTAGCGSTADERSDPRDEERRTPRGACISSAAHKLCGGEISAGAGSVASAGRRVLRGHVTLSAPDVASAQHRIVRGEVSP
jgi:hypothetical protein